MYQPFTKTSVKLMIAMSLGITSISTIAKSVIVELNEAPAAHAIYKAREAGTPLSAEQIQLLRSDLARKQDRFLQTIKALGINATLESVNIPLPNAGTTNVQHRYTLVFNGMTLDVADASISELSSLANVKKVHEVKELTPMLDASVEYTRAPELYGETYDLTAYDNFGDGFEGQGTYVAVIDTGIDWANPMFGDDITPPRHGATPPVAGANNNKVAYYLPIAGEIMDGYGHGTHVAATAAGYKGWAPGADGIPNTDDDVPLHGVAPQAQLMAYQVCNGSGRCVTPATILALEDAVSPRSLTGYAKPVADVINLSLGGPGGPDDASAIAASNAALAGAVVVAAAGNSGPGESTIGSPAAGRHVIAVAASNDPGVVPNSVEVLTEDGNTVDTSIAAMVAALAADSNLQRPITDPIVGNYVFAGFADTPDQVPVSVLGNICLTVRGSTVDVEAADAGTGLIGNKAANCQAKGAIATLVYNSEPGEIGPVLAPGASPIVTISGVSGLILQDLGYGSDGVSLRLIQLNPLDPNVFVPSIAGFSSRGPVEGSGQIKADVAAPGVEILAATTKTGPPTATMADPSGYTVASGTSMASPHVAGAAALVRQVNPSWSAGTVRAALMNTATNPRYVDGTAKAHNLSNDSILAQGAGLMDVRSAAQTTVIMGVEGDGIIEPKLLASYSYGSRPLVNNRIMYSEKVVVTMQGLDSDELEYRLRVANNRELQLDGINVALSTSTITVAGDNATEFLVVAQFDGDKVRDLGKAGQLEMMWYVIAEPINAGETLRMPFYLKPTMSEPAEFTEATETEEPVSDETEETFSGSILVGDNNLSLVQGVTYQDHSITLEDASYQLVGDLTYTGNGVDDIDLFLLDPDGAQIGSSTNGGGPEQIRISVSGPGTYTYRVSGWVNAEVNYELVSTITSQGSNSQQKLVPSAPVLSLSSVEFTNNQGGEVDFNGEFTLQWAAINDALKFEIEQSIDGVHFTSVDVISADTTNYSIAGLGDGTYSYRVRAWFRGQIGFYIAQPSNVVEVLVDRRSQVDITAQIKTTISNYDLASLSSLELSITNESDTNYVPNMELQVFNLQSNSGTVRLSNADTGGSGIGEDGGMFDYSQLIGSDDIFTANETSGTRRMEFDNPQGELFLFEVNVTAFESTSSNSNSTSSMQEEDAGQPTLAEQVIRVTVNPLTGSVTTELVTPSSLNTKAVKPLTGL
jgi:subtilisin family serine protease